MLKNLFLRSINVRNKLSSTLLTPKTYQNCCKLQVLPKIGGINENQNIQARLFNTSSCLERRSDRLNEKSSRRIEGHGSGEGTEGEHSVNIDHLNRYERLFPDENTPDLLFEGVRFADLHNVTAVCTKNNVKFRVLDAKGSVLLRHSCTKEGFKNAQKSTSIAAQTTGVSLAKKMLELGIRNAKVKLDGFGFGRVSAIKGLTMGGINVVSISDITIFNYNTASPRPKKRRRV